jgi:hypothetical protein
MKEAAVPVKLRKPEPFDMEGTCATHIARDPQGSAGFFVHPTNPAIN